VALVVAQRYEALLSAIPRDPIGVQNAPGLTYFNPLGAVVATLGTVLGNDVATEEPPQLSTSFLTRPYSL
jgi:hypothetical protein